MGRYGYGLGSQRRLVGRQRWLLHVIILITCRSNSAAQFKLLEHQFVETNRQITTSFCLVIKLDLVCTVRRATIRIVARMCVLWQIACCIYHRAVYLLENLDEECQKYGVKYELGGRLKSNLTIIFSKLSFQSCSVQYYSCESLFRCLEAVTVKIFFRLHIGQTQP